MSEQQTGVPSCPGCGTAVDPRRGPWCETCAEALAIYEPAAGPLAVPAGDGQAGVPAVPGVTRWRKKPIEVKAVQWTGRNFGEVREFGSGAVGIGPVDGGALPLWVVKSSATCRVERGDWIIRESDGSGFYPCAADAFAATYEPATVPAEPGALSASVTLPVPDDTGRGLPSTDAPPRDRTGAVAELRRIADQDIGANAPWLAGRLHALADQLAAEMSGECQMTAGQVAHTACDTAVTGLQAERDEARAKLAAIREYLDDRKGDAGLSLLHAGDILAITGTGEGHQHRERPGDQQLPVPNDGPSMHDLAADDVRRRHPGGRAPEIHAVIRDLAARKALGLDRYGSLLQAHNGRDALRDLHEEQLDAIVYCRQWLEENDEEHPYAVVMRRVYQDLLTGALTVRMIMDDAAIPAAGTEADHG